jgi:hypothetical protein
VRVAIIVSVWLLVTGGIGEEVLAGAPQRGLPALLLLQLAVTVLTALALWAEFDDDAPPAGRFRRRRSRWLVH